MVQKIYSKMHPVSCTDAHLDDIDLLNHGMAENTKTWISREGNIKFLTCASDYTFCSRGNP